MAERLEVVAPAGTPAALRAAVAAGADAVYLGLRDATNARNFPGLNFTLPELADGVAFAHARRAKVFLAVNTYTAAGAPEPWFAAIDAAAALGVDAVILADIGLLDYAKERHPGLRRHLSVQASAGGVAAIGFYREAFGVARVVLPRVFTTADIARLNAAVDVETEVFAFGGMCPMAEGRCLLSSYATGAAPNRQGVCSPASHVSYQPEVGGALASRLGGFTINRFAAGEPAGYPTLCKGRFRAADKTGYLFEDPTSLDATALLPELAAAGVTAIKIEGRQRGRAYVERVVRGFRRAVDAVARGEAPPPLDLEGETEGASATTGAYRKGWR
jgi:putative protease